MSVRAGLVGLPLLTLYSAAKYALEGFSEALAYELAPLNIGVKLIEPSGGVSGTDFGKRLGTERAQTTSLVDYDEFIACTNAAYAKRMATAGEVAQVLYEAATDSTGRLRYFCGEDTGDLLKSKRDMPDEKFIEFMRSRFQLRDDI
jgi:NAD(P)-dependent dehydrogenase (short-subunit alcohol dehydrogenase family)